MNDEDAPDNGGRVKATGEEYDLIEGIKANPADQTAWLVYADWLEEFGDAEQAAFIRGAIADARTGGARARVTEPVARTSSGASAADSTAGICGGAPSCITTAGACYPITGPGGVAGARVISL